MGPRAGAYGFRKIRDALSSPYPSQRRAARRLVGVVLLALVLPVAALLVAVVVD